MKTSKHAKTKTNIKVRKDSNRAHCRNVNPFVGGIRILAIRSGHLAYCRLLYDNTDTERERGSSPQEPRIRRYSSPRL